MIFYFMLRAITAWLEPPRKHKIAVQSENAASEQYGDDAKANGN